MNTLETNIFSIGNLSELSSRYRLYRVRGLSKDQEDYHKNLNSLVTKCSRDLLSPVTAIERDGSPWLVVCEGDSEPKSPQMLIRRSVYLDKSAETLVVDFGRLSQETLPIAVRFLQFATQGALRRRSHLWQPNGGGAFFEKRPRSVQRGIGMYCGYLVRATALPNGSIGLCVDARHKYISAEPLPSILSRKDFQRFKMSHAIYHFGHTWFEVRLAEWSELTVQEQVFEEKGRQISLLEYIQEKSMKPLPPELVRLPKDCSVVHYYNSSKDMRSAPSALCHQVFDTVDGRVRSAHGRSIMPPDLRRHGIGEFVARHLGKITVGGTPIQVFRQPLEVQRKHFQVPDLKFGSQRVLSVKGNPGTQHVQLHELGRARLSLLTSKSAGFVTNSALQRQFFFMPETIHRSWGPQMMRDLCAKVDGLYPTENGYEPQLIVYDDRRSRTFVEQGTALLKAAKERGASGGFAVVMIHEPTDRIFRRSDQLAAYAIRALREECDITTSVMHTATGTECYDLRRDMGGQVKYAIRHDRRGRLDGYLRNVALNKVLLTNEKWPFVLNERTHADLILGVDVKSNFAGFVAVGRGGSYMSATQGMICRQAEQLSVAEFRKLMLGSVREYVKATSDLAASVVIHRDGRMFETEVTGAESAFNTLVEEGLLLPNATLNCVEIGKSSFTSLRLFDLVRSDNHSRPFIRNPEVGDYFIASARDGYLCATGRAFPRHGTVYPLHVSKLSGPATIETLLEDVYRLTVLAWTRPEDCTRYPITIKLNDRRLFEDAGDFDEHEINLHEEVVA